MAVRVPGAIGACRHERGLIDESAVKSGGFRYRLTGLWSGRRQRSRPTPGRFGSTATNARPRRPSPGVPGGGRRRRAGTSRRRGRPRCERAADASGIVVEMHAEAAGRAPGRMSALRRRRDAAQSARRRVAPGAETEPARQAGRGRRAPTQLRRERVAGLDKVAPLGLARPGAQVTGDRVEEWGRAEAEFVDARPPKVPARALPGRRPGWHAGRQPRTPRWHAPLQSSGIFGAGAGVAPGRLPAGELDFRLPSLTSCGRPNCCSRETVRGTPVCSELFFKCPVARSCTDRYRIARARGMAGPVLSCWIGAQAFQVLLNRFRGWRLMSRSTPQPRSRLRPFNNYKGVTR